MTATAWMLVIVVLAGIVCAWAGVFLVLRKGAMTADAISHAVLPGLVAAFWLSGSRNLLTGFLGALFAALLTVGLVEWLAQRARLRQDTALGLVFPAMFALGVLWVSLAYQDVHLDTDAVLFGDLTLAPFDRLSLSGQDLGPNSFWLMIGSLLIVSVTTTLLHRPLLSSAFDETYAKLIGLKPALANAALMTVVATAIVAAFTAVGAILAVALVVVPATIGLLWRRAVLGVTLIAIGTAAAAATLGTGLALQWDLSPAGMVVVILGSFYGLSVLFAPERGWYARRLQAEQARVQDGVMALCAHLQRHAGTADESTENTREHLQSELGWTEAQTNRILSTAQQLGIIRESEGQIHYIGPVDSPTYPDKQP